MLPQRDAGVEPAAARCRGGTVDDLERNELAGDAGEPEQES